MLFHGEDAAEVPHAPYHGLLDWRLALRYGDDHPEWITAQAEILR